ncbi:MAG: amidohydrolase, partial [Rhodothermales bacterium]|nr:amidohydrolase [Rhodothermales bacterium]
MRFLPSLFLLALLGCATDQSEAPETVLFENGIIHTMDEATPQADAILVTDGRVAAVGSGPDLLAQAPDAERRDLGGQVVIPGLIDAHAHVRNLATMRLA